MDNYIVSILTLILGLVLGVIYNILKSKNVESKANKIIEHAKKEADKHKRDSIFELKE